MRLPKGLSVGRRSRLTRAFLRGRHSERSTPIRLAAHAAVGVFTRALPCISRSCKTQKERRRWQPKSRCKPMFARNEVCAGEAYAAAARPAPVRLESKAERRSWKTAANQRSEF